LSYNLKNGQDAVTTVKKGSESPKNSPYGEAIMRKTAVIFLLMSFALFLSAQAFPGEKSSTDFALSKLTDQSHEKFSRDFSLARNENKKTCVLSIDYEKFVVREFAQVSGRVAELEQEIKKLKSKRKNSLLFSIVLGGISGFCLYEFIVYEQSERETQEGRHGTGLISGNRIIYLGGTLISAAITFSLVSDYKKKGRTIKEYEQELKNLGEQQSRLSQGGLR
jgi:hypothetical protein